MLTRQCHRRDYVASTRGYSSTSVPSPAAADPALQRYSWLRSGFCPLPALLAALKLRLTHAGQHFSSVKPKAQHPKHRALTPNPQILALTCHRFRMISFGETCNAMPARPSLFRAQSCRWSATASRQVLSGFYRVQTGCTRALYRADLMLCNVLMGVLRDRIMWLCLGYRLSLHGLYSKFRLLGLITVWTPSMLVLARCRSHTLHLKP